MTDFNLMKKALDGDDEAVRIYCGSYDLVMSLSNKKLYRCNGDFPNGFSKVHGVYDSDGFLKSEYWALPRILINESTS